MEENTDISVFIEALGGISQHYPNILVSFVDSIWCMYEGEITWNTDDSLEDLAYLEGDSYSATVTENSKEVGEYTIVNVDTQTGTWETLIFPNSKRKTLEELDV